MKNKKALPYYGSADFFSNVKKSSSFRKRNIFSFLYIKIKNYLLGLAAYTCPVNNLRVLFHKWRGVNIGKNVFIGMRCTLDHAYPEYIYIEDNVILSGDIYIVAHNKPSIHFKKKVPSFVAPVIIKKNAFIGVRSVFFPNVTFGEGSFASGASVISENVPDNVLVRGNPAKIIHNFK
jgi:acetyltransferase-like isoleucine patch superfamily enzyme